jgi:hypothetical protein
MPHFETWGIANHADAVDQALKRLTHSQGPKGVYLEPHRLFFTNQGEAARAVAEIHGWQRRKDLEPKDDFQPDPLEESDSNNMIYAFETGLAHDEVIRSLDRLWPVPKMPPHVWMQGNKVSFA